MTLLSYSIPLSRNAARKRAALLHIAFSPEAQGDVPRAQIRGKSGSESGSRLRRKVDLVVPGREGEYDLGGVKVGWIFGWTFR